MENTDIAEIFNEIADLMEIKGDNPFKIRAYRNAAQVIEDLPITLESIVEREEKDLEDLPGIGKALHEKIVEIIKTGRCSFLDELFKELPSGLLDMLKVSGIGPKKVKVIYEVLAVSSLDELEEAAREGRLKHLPGMGEKTETNILKSIKTLKASAGRYGIADAMQIAEEFTGYLKELSGVIKAVPAGSLRRGRETVGDIDILVTSKKDTPVMEKFVSHPRVERILGKGETKSSIVLKSGLQIDLRVVEEKAFGAALHYFSGSKQHNVAMRDRAKKMGLKISEYGVFRGSDHSWLAGKTEEEVFKAVGLSWIPPELRENRGEMEAAEHETLPELININDIIGDLHMHTAESDGKDSIEEMADYAINKGYQYIAITDHSKAVGIAHGLDETRVLKQIEEVDRVNGSLKKNNVGFRILKGIEVDIKMDGSLDLDEEVLRELDVVVGSVHSGFTMPEDEMTKRIIKAMSTGLLNIIGHPTGRLIRWRPPYAVDMVQVLKAAKDYNVAMEINASPQRLDLSDIHCRLAKDLGVKVVISTDSHNKFQMENMHFGVTNGRRGWLEADDVFNTKPLDEFLAALGK